MDGVVPRRVDFRDCDADTRKALSLAYANSYAGEAARGVHRDTDSNAHADGDCDGDSNFVRADGDSDAHADAACDFDDWGLDGRGLSVVSGFWRFYSQ